MIIYGGWKGGRKGAVARLRDHRGEEGKLARFYATSVSLFLSEAFSDFRPFSRFCRRDIVEELLAGWRGDWWSDGGGALFAYNEKIRFSSNFRVHPSRF